MSDDHQSTLKVAESAMLDWPRDVTRALNVLADQLRVLRISGVQGLYIHGSLALQDYRPGQSDIDFVAVTENPLTTAGVAEFERLHLRLRLRFPRLRFQGTYIPRAAFAAGAAQDQHTVWFDGGWIRSQHTTAWNEVTRYELATRAVPLFGPPRQSVVGAPDLPALLAYVRQNMNDYWTTWVDHAERRPFDVIAATLLAARIEWGVLGVARQLYTLREHDVISKTGAGEYTLKLAPAQYQRIIGEALDHRSGRWKSRYLNWWERRADALGFMRWVIAQANDERKASDFSRLSALDRR